MLEFLCCAELSFDLPERQLDQDFHEELKLVAAASNHHEYAEMEEISKENKDNLSTEAKCLEMIEVASFHG